MDKRLSLFQSKSIIVLAAGMVLVAAWGVSMTGWVSVGLYVVAYVGLGAIIIGLMLARSMLPGAIAHLFSLIIGIAWSFWMTSRLLPDEFLWPERWQEMAFRLTHWYNLAIQGGVSHDNLMFILQMAVIVWAMGYLTLWFLFRSGKVWQAIVPGALVLVINLYYAPNDITFWFLAYILFSLLVVIRFNLFHQQSKWRTEGVFFRPDISFDFLRDGLIFSTLIIGLAWLTPPAFSDTSGVFDEFQGTWHDLQKGWNRLYADLNYRNPRQLGAFGETLTLGGPRYLTEEPVMDVRVEGEGRYWRATVYDQYTGFGWRNTDEDSATFGPEADLSLPTFAARRAVTQTYFLYHDGTTALYAMNHPVGLNRSAKVTFNTVPAKYSVPSNWPKWSNFENPSVEEITYIRSNAAVDKGESYQVVSAASQAAVEQLQAAGTDYPAWITERYLQLPGTVTERTLQLAHDLTANDDTPYDKAETIERYLRREIEYNEQISLPPPDVDKVDYILFDLKEAYCDYYASSMIVMLRALGIPARMAVGYAQGDYDSEQDVFHVLNADAHAWVEVYFPTYGWIEFEPTAAQPIIARRLAANNLNANANSGLTPEELESDRIPGMPEENVPIDEEIGGGVLPAASFTLPILGITFNVPRSVVSGGITAVVIVLGVGLAAATYWWRQQQLEAARSIFKLYDNMIRLAGWMGATVRSWHTPYERATVLKEHLPPYQQEVDTITNEYVRQTFSKQPAQVTVDTILSHQSIRAWRRLRPEMMKAAIKRRLPWRP